MNKKKMACFLMALVMTISVISIHTLAEEKVKLHIMKTVTKGQIDMERSNILELENRLGVELEVEIPPTSAYQERIRTLFSIGQKLPDIICDIPTDMVADLLEAGIIIPLESYLENTTYLKELYAQMPGYLTANTYDGHLACFPIMGYNRGIGGSFIRLDWLENLELTHLVDLENCRIKLEDLETILHAFTFNDPDQNGENDTYGWGMPAPNHWTTYVPNLIQGAFGAGYGMKRADDGHYYDATLEDPLQLVLREIIILSNMKMFADSLEVEDVENLGITIKYATILVATLPVLLVYPFLQRYFVKGVMVGAVKG